MDQLVPAGGVGARASAPELLLGINIMDAAKTIEGLKQQAISVTGVSEKEVASLNAKIDLVLQNFGLDQSTAAILLLALAGILFVALLAISSRRSSTLVTGVSASLLEERIASLEQTMHDIKTQMSMVKGQVKADFGFIRQELNELHNSVAAAPVESFQDEDRSVAVNGR